MSVKDVCDLNSLLQGDDEEYIELDQKLKIVNNSIEQQESRLQLEEDQHLNLVSQFQMYQHRIDSSRQSLDLNSISLDHLNQILTQIDLNLHRSTFQSYMDQKQDLETSILNFESQLSTFESRIQFISETSNDSSSTFSTLKTKINNVESLLDSETSTISQLLQKEMTLNSSIDLLKSSISSNQLKLSDLTLIHCQLTESNHSSIETLGITENTLKEKLNQMKTDLERARHQRSVLDSQLRSINSIHSQSLLTETALAEQISILSNEISGNENQMSQASSQLIELLSTQSQIKLVIQDQELQLLSLKNMLSRLQENLSSESNVEVELQEQLINLNSFLETCQLEKSLLLESINSLRCQFESLCSRNLNDDQGINLLLKSISQLQCQSEDLLVMTNQETEALQPLRVSLDSHFERDRLQNIRFNIFVDLRQCVVDFQDSVLKNNAIPLIVIAPFDETEDKFLLNSRLSSEYQTQEKLLVELQNSGQTLLETLQTEKSRQEKFRKKQRNTILKDLKNEVRETVDLEMRTLRLKQSGLDEEMKDVYRQLQHENEEEAPLLRELMELEDESNRLDADINSPVVYPESIPIVPIIPKPLPSPKSKKTPSLTQTKHKLDFDESDFDLFDPQPIKKYSSKKSNK